MLYLAGEKDGNYGIQYTSVFDKQLDIFDGNMKEWDNMSSLLEDVFLLWHTHNLDDNFGVHEEVKLIGVFSSEAKAKEAIEQLKGKEGFRNYPRDCFEVHKTKIDQPGWVEGFFVARWTE